MATPAAACLRARTVPACHTAIFEVSSATDKPCVLLHALPLYLVTLVHPAAACSATPGCVVVPRVVTKGSADLCVSQQFNRLSKDQMNQFMVELALAEPAVVGSCDGACWMRQVCCAFWGAGVTDGGAGTGRGCCMGLVF